MAHILHQSPAGHGHSTGGYEQLESAGGCLPGRAPLPGSTSVRAAFVHVVGDLLQSLGVLVAATIIYFKVPGLDSPTLPVGTTPPAPRGVLGGTGTPILCPLTPHCAQPHTAHVPCSPSARSQTPSAPSSSRSSSSAPPSPSSETSSESSWKVNGGQGGCGATGAGCKGLGGCNGLGGCRGLGGHRSSSGLQLVQPLTTQCPTLSFPGHLRPPSPGKRPCGEKLPHPGATVPSLGKPPPR